MIPPSRPANKTTKSSATTLVAEDFLRKTYSESDHTNSVGTKEALFSPRRFASRYRSDPASHAISSITIPSGVVNQLGFPGTAAHPKAEAFFHVSALSGT